MTNSNLMWEPASWKKFQAIQQPDWASHPELASVKSQLSGLPPLVFAGEIENLKRKLILAGEGKAFVLQGGDCSESFRECTASTIRETLKVLLQMAVVLTYAGSKPVVKIGRIAGQFAKPRSNPTEIVNGTELPSYRGDMVNRDAPTLADRQANPLNMLEGYYRATSTLNLLRAYTKGGFASLKNIHRWNKDFVLNSSAGQKYEVIADHIDEALHFMEAIGFDLDEVQQLKEVNFYTSHEALLLDYEEPLTRKDSLTQKWYGCSAHMLWIGDRTRQPDGAHIEYMRGIHNPIGLKIGPNYSPDEIKRILDTLNPANDKGKILLITRFGADKIEIHLPKLIRMIKQSGANVVWICDPMHGNTYSASNKLKTRSFDHIFREISDFFRIHYTEGTLPGGIHIELTGLDVTECIGGIQGIDENLLTRNYASNCDPRLNASQSIELAFRLAEMIRG